MTPSEAERLDRLDNHFKVYKSDLIEVRDSVKNIENALIGSNYNGNKGIVHLVSNLHKRLDKIENKQLLNDDFVTNLKWFQRGMIGIVFAYLTWLLTK